MRLCLASEHMCLKACSLLPAGVVSEVMLNVERRTCNVLLSRQNALIDTAVNCVVLVLKG